MSESSAEIPVDPAGGRFAWLARLRLRFRKSAAIEGAPADEPDNVPPPQGAMSRLRGWLLRLRPAKAAATDDMLRMPVDDTETAAPAGDAEAEAPAWWQSLFDSPVKIALLVGSALLLVLLVALIVVLLVKKPAKPRPAPAATAAVQVKPHVTTPAAAPAKHASPAVSAHPGPTAHEPVADKSLLEERARLEQMKAELEQQRQQFEAEKKAFAEQAGRQANGAVVSRRPAADLAGSCELSGNKGTLRDNLRACLGLPPKPAAEPAKADNAAPPADAKPAPAAH